MTAVAPNLDALCVNTIRGLCMDAIERTHSGSSGNSAGHSAGCLHPVQRYLRFDPADPIWPNRDRFMLSEGHASALLWSLLHLTRMRAVDPDYEVVGRAAVALDDLKTFRQQPHRVRVPGRGLPQGPRPTARCRGVRAAKRFLGMPEDAEFYVPDAVVENFRQGMAPRRA
jgi:hypothetical protein